MIPVVFFNSDTRYTIITNDCVVLGKVTDSAFGKIVLMNVDTYDLSLNARRSAEKLEIDYADIISAGFCADSRYTARNDLCWQLNSLPVKNV